MQLLHTLTIDPLTKRSLLNVEESKMTERKFVAPRTIIASMCYVHVCVCYMCVLHMLRMCVCVTYVAYVCVHVCLNVNQF